MTEPIKLLEDGASVTNDHGYPVGYCQECRRGGIIKGYFFKQKMYCISCFPQVIAVHNALQSLKESKVNCIHCGKTQINCIHCGFKWAEGEFIMCPQCNKSERS